MMVPYGNIGKVSLGSYAWKYNHSTAVLTGLQ